MIKIDNLTKTYTSKEGDIQALKGVSLYVGRGRIFGVIGQSGAGKSTLIRCINMLERPTSGTVTVDGKDMGALTGKELLRARQEISMIFQHFNLLASRTVFDNVAYPLEIQGLKKSAITERVLPLLELVGLHERARYYPSQLSGGQKQRVGIARALASRPKVLLCDEATSALDPQTTKSILALLKDINKKFDLTIVLITHEMIVIKEICDKVAVIENGRIVEEGGVLEVFTNPRTQTAREFIGTVISQHLPPFLSEIGLSPVPVDSGKLLVRLSFIGASAGQPILAGAIRAYNVDISIIYGNIDSIKDTPFGTLIAEVSGKSDDINSALAYFGRQNLRVEVLGYVP
ncbi:MAG: methionine ABC transporter ATP-binding protein [Acidaminococcales bacterium]|nr:methionine ABC transporter ATP-binding protein [Acidaminococcales bacterium]